MCAGEFKGVAGLWSLSVAIEMLIFSRCDADAMLG
jgi:hypothetical protein